MLPAFFHVLGIGTLPLLHFLLHHPDTRLKLLSSSNGLSVHLVPKLKEIKASIEASPDLTASYGELCIRIDEVLHLLECFHCGAFSAKSICGGCRMIALCGKTCQTASWTKHKSVCKGGSKKVANVVKASANIHQLALSGQTTQLDQALSLEPTRVEEKDRPDTKTVLHYAAERGHYEMMVMLVEKHKADIEARGFKGRFTPLCYCVTRPQDPFGRDMYPIPYQTRVKMVKYLLDKGADPNPSGQEINMSPLSGGTINNFFQNYFSGVSVEII
jgi:hypothetical protein